MSIGISGLASLITAIGTPLASMFSSSSNAATTIHSTLTDIEAHPNDLGSVARDAQTIQQVAAMNGMPDIAGLAGSLYETVTAQGAVAGPQMQAAIFEQANAIAAALSQYVGSIFSVLRGSATTSASAA